jgi:hypothetical protein
MLKTTLNPSQTAYKAAIESKTKLKTNATKTQSNTKKFSNTPRNVGEILKLYLLPIYPFMEGTKQC